MTSIVWEIVYVYFKKCTMNSSLPLVTQLGAWKVKCDPYSHINIIKKNKVLHPQNKCSRKKKKRTWHHFTLHSQNTIALAIIQTSLQLTILFICKGNKLKSNKNNSNCANKKVCTFSQINPFHDGDCYESFGVHRLIRIHNILGQFCLYLSSNVDIVHP